MIKEAIGAVAQGRDLSAEEMAVVMDEVMSGQATAAQIGGLLTALHMKGESRGEIAGAARTMRAKATKVPVKVAGLVDTCGTGGDGKHTFNISTTVAFVVAGAGVPVAKHGNRAVSSGCGSADVLEALGVRIDLGPEEAAECLAEAGIGFLFAPIFHTAMRHAVGPRRELGFRTIFNVLGPLANPAGTTRQVVGVYDRALTRTIAEVLVDLGTEHSLVVHGAGGADELTLAGENLVCECRDGGVREYTLRPAAVGLAEAPLSALAGGDARENADLLLGILRGEPGPRRDAVLLNAAAAFLAADRVADFAEGVRLAAETLDSGAALDALERLRRASERAGARGRSSESA
ncbi:MAG TPA: anthranilate phosphoribosyltransferase [Firmicutes bacterium]|nr:anthranilate phosphoribosyltransferase [Bacillota bacterium]